jgi:hypothetical protein
MCRMSEQTARVWPSSEWSIAGASASEAAAAWQSCGIPTVADGDVLARCRRESLADVVSSIVVVEL